MRSMATWWSDEDVAASPNPMGMPTGQGKTWTAHRVSSLRRGHRISPTLPREEPRMAQDVRGRDNVWSLAPSPPTAHQGRHYSRGAGLCRCAVSDRDSDLQHERVTAAMGRTAPIVGSPLALIRAFD